MKELHQYINEVLGLDINTKSIKKEYLGKLPLYIIEIYKLHETLIFNQKILLVEYNNTEFFSIFQIEKHFSLLKKELIKKVVLVMPELSSINRKRLIEKGVNFIVPGKQLFLPELLLDLKEHFSHPRAKRAKNNLLPSAQFLLLYHIIHRNDNWKIENHSFKEIAIKTGYTAMTVTKAVENLKNLELIEVVGGKEKLIQFKLNIAELWYEIERQKLFVNPVLKRVYVDNKPEEAILNSNTSALPEYTDMNPDRMTYFAIDKTSFYRLQKNNALINVNEMEGKYCLEVWKYNPLTLVGEFPNDTAVVDPLSLFLSLQDSIDERIEIALEQIIEKFIW